MLSFGLAFLFLTGQSPVANLREVISFSSRAARAEVLLPSLGKASHLTLSTTPEMGSEVLLVDFQNKQIGDVLERIATVTSGKWKQEANGFRLVADRQVRRQEEISDIKLKVEAVRKNIRTAEDRIKQKVGAIAKIGQPTQKPQKGVPAMTPAQIALAKLRQTMNIATEAAALQLIKDLDLAEIVQLSSWDRIVYSTNPTNAQRQLPNRASDAIDAFIQTHNEQAGKLEQQFPEPDPAKVSPDRLEALRKTRQRQIRRIESVGKSIVQVVRIGTHNIHGQLIIYRTNGTIAWTSGIELNDIDFNSVDLDNGDEKEDVKKPESLADAKIPYSPDSQALVDIAISPSSPFLTLPPALIAKLFHPEKYEPLSFVKADILSAVSRKSLKAIVADIPDDWDVDCGLFEGVLVTTLDEVLERVKNRNGIQQLPDSEFDLFVSSSPSCSRKNRADRFALGAVLKSVETQGVPSLEAFTNLANTFDDDAPDGIAQGILMSLVPNQNQMEFMEDGCGYWNSLKLFGTFSLAQRDVLFSSGKLPIATLSPEQKALVQRMLYGSDVSLEKDDSTSENPGIMRFNDYRDEPTEVLPNGLGDFGYIDLSQTVETFAFPIPPKGSFNLGSASIYGPEELAVNLIRKQFGNEPDASQKPVTFDQLKLGTTVSLEFGFHVAPGIKFTTEFRSFQFPQSPIITTEENLPADFKKKVQLALEGLKDTEDGPSPKQRTIHP